jgi:hypothetical protein
MSVSWRRDSARAAEGDFAASDILEETRRDWKGLSKGREGPVYLKCRVMMLFWKLWKLMTPWVKAQWGFLEGTWRCWIALSAGSMSIC